MASTHFLAILLLLFCFVQDIGHGAVYCFHGSTQHVHGEKTKNHPEASGRAGHRFHHPLFGFLPKGVPVPPSGPSGGHNQATKGAAHKGSAKTRGEDMSGYQAKGTPRRKLKTRNWSLVVGGRTAAPLSDDLSADTSTCKHFC